MLHKGTSRDWIVNGFPLDKRCLSPVNKKRRITRRIIHPFITGMIREKYLCTIPAVQDDDGLFQQDGAGLREQGDVVVGPPGFFRALPALGPNVPGRAGVSVDRARATIRREDVASTTHAVDR